METGGGEGVAEAGHPEGIPQLLRQGHHGTAEHQGRQQTTPLRAGGGDQALGDAAP